MVSKKVVFSVVEVDIRKKMKKVVTLGRSWRTEDVDILNLVLDHRQEEKVIIVSGGRQREEDIPGPPGDKERLLWSKTFRQFRLVQDLRVPRVLATKEKVNVGQDRGQGLREGQGDLLR
jgi:hypothetical protein